MKRSAAGASWSSLKDSTRDEAERGPCRRDRRRAAPPTGRARFIHEFIRRPPSRRPDADGSTRAPREAEVLVLSPRILTRDRRRTDRGHAPVKSGTSHRALKRPAARPHTSRDLAYCRHRLKHPNCLLQRPLLPMTIQDEGNVDRRSGEGHRDPDRPQQPGGGLGGAVVGPCGAQDEGVANIGRDELQARSASPPWSTAGCARRCGSC